MTNEAQLLSSRDSTLNILLVLRTHTFLFLWLFFGLKLPVELYVPLSLLACLIHQRAISEWIHESAHFNFVRNRAWNDRWTHVLLGVFFLNDIRQHRYGHAVHHRQSTFFQPSDGDTWHLTARTRSELRNGALRDLFGMTAIQLLASRQNGERTPSTRGLKVVYVLVHGLIAAGLWWSGFLLPYVLYIGCVGTLYPFMNRLRVYAQHANSRSSEATMNTNLSRDMRPNWLDRLFFTSDLMRLHRQHHLKPSVPFRLLSETGEVEAISHFGHFLQVYRQLPK